MVLGVETGREVGKRGQIRKGFVEEQCFKFGVRVSALSLYRPNIDVYFLLYETNIACLTRNDS